MSTVDDIKARLDIVDVLSGYINLQKAGRNYKALCPFHQERTPSFIVFPDTQTWRCFGACGEGGDIFSFVMKVQGWDFSETLRELAKRAGVELKPLTPAQAERDSENDRLRSLLHEAAAFFNHHLLNAPDGQIARDYLKKRALNHDTIEAFLLGYAPHDWHQALHHLQQIGYTQDEIIEAGIAIRSDKGSVYDRFRHRLMIPIRDGRGTIVGFGARALSKDDNPKYLNSPQGPLFDKSRLLFALDRARHAIRETETVIVVEGYMDAMQAHQAGYQNVVAQMGTALTETQLRQLERYAKRLILALDPDAAGMSATMRGLDVARQTLEGDQTVTFDPRGMMRYTGSLEMEIRVVSLPDGQDPDDLIRNDPAAWETLIEQAIPVADYVIRQGTAHLTEKSSYHEREAAARELLPILTATESDLQRNGNIQALARRVRIDERTLIQWTQRRQVIKTRALPSLREQRKLAGRFEPKRAGGPPGQSALRESFCLRLLLYQPDWLFAANRKLRELRGRDPNLDTVLGPLCADDFSRPDHQVIFRVLHEALQQDEVEPPDYLRAVLPVELTAAVEELQFTPLEQFQQVLPKSLAIELESILRDQARLNALPQVDVNLFIQEALTLRRNRLEREGHELYFLQEDARLAGDYLAEEQHNIRVEINKRARELITRTLKQMGSFARDR